LFSFFLSFFSFFFFSFICFYLFLFLSFFLLYSFILQSEEVVEAKLSSLHEAQFMSNVAAEASRFASS